MQARGKVVLYYPRGTGIAKLSFNYWKISGAHTPVFLRLRKLEVRHLQAAVGFVESQLRLEGCTQLRTRKTWVLVLAAIVSSSIGSLVSYVVGMLT